MDWENVTGENPNLTRFLSFLGKAEGADWNTVVGGGKFSDFSQHPNVVGMRTADGPSTAAGRYQITGTTYRDVAPKIGVTDFSPESQNQVAIELMRRSGALDDVLAGNFEPAINKLGGVWASLPSSTYNQPKRDWNFVKANLTGSTADDGWETISPAATSPAPQASNDGWETVTPAAPAPQAATPAPAAVVPVVPTKPAAPPAKKDERGVMRRVDDFVRGAADTLTFGYADELSAKADAAVKNSALDKWVQKNLGFSLSQSGGADYEAALAAQRKRDTEGGYERTAGQVGGAVVPLVKGIRAAQTAGVLGRMGAGAVTGAVQGGLYGSGSAEGDIESRIKGAKTGATVGAITGGVLGGIIPASSGQKVESFVRNSGDEARAATDAEILRRAKAVFSDTNRMTGKTAPVVSAAELNGKVTESFLREGKDLVASLPKDFAGKADLTSALGMGRRLDPAAIEALRTSKAGNAVADIIQAAQRADKLTAALPARGGILGTAARTAVDAVPATISATTGIPVIIGSSITEGIKQKLGGRVSREGVIQKMLDKQSGVVDAVTARTGPAAAVGAKDVLSGIADKATLAKQAQIELAKKAAEAKATQAAATRIQVLQDTRRPLSGAFQELLQGGASNLNLSSKEAIDALRLVSRQQKDGPVGTAAMEILRSGNVPNKDAFYGLQNQLRKMQENGILANQQGALTNATSSGVRNPVSYAEAVRTAGEAANLARASAPTKELAQFATTVAGTKSPAAKAKLIAERLATTSDPAEQAFLSKFVEPLANFGKK